MLFSMSIGHKQRNWWRKLTLQAKVGEDSNVLGPLLTLGQFSKDQKPPVALARSQANRFPSDGQGVKIALGDIASLHDSKGTNGLVREVDEGHKDTGRENPFRNLQGNTRLNFRRPLVKDQ